MKFPKITFVGVSLFPFPFVTKLEHINYLFNIARLVTEFISNTNKQ